jgi:hypothetical protein
MRWLSISYTVIFFAGALVCLLIGSIGEYGARTTPGCNLYDALLYGVRCQGFIGSSVVSTIANFSLLIIQLSAISLISPIFALLAIFLWSPVLYSFYLTIKRIKYKILLASK